MPEQFEYDDDYNLVNWNNVTDYMVDDDNWLARNFHKESDDANSELYDPNTAISLSLDILTDAVRRIQTILESTS